MKSDVNKAANNYIRLLNTMRQMIDNTDAETTIEAVDMVREELTKELKNALQPLNPCGDLAGVLAGSLANSVLMLIVSCN